MQLNVLKGEQIMVSVILIQRFAERFEISYVKFRLKEYVHNRYLGMFYFISICYLHVYKSIFKNHDGKYFLIQ